MIDFDSMIDNYLKKENKPKTVGRYYPSEIGTCMRKTWFSYKEPTETSPELIKVFEIGNIVHDFVAKVLESDKNPNVEVLQVEFPFKHEIDDFIISGRIDDLILVKENDTRVLVEVKSTGEVRYVNEPIEYNVDQLQFYMHVLGIHEGILLYVDKKNLKSRVFRIKYDSQRAEKIIQRFKKLHENLKNNYISEPEARLSEETMWICRLCPYRDKCYKITPRSDKWL